MSHHEFFAKICNHNAEAGQYAKWVFAHYGPKISATPKTQAPDWAAFLKKMRVDAFYGSHTFGALSLKSLRTTSNASTHTLFLSLGLEPTSIVGIQIKYCSKVTKTKEWFFCKPQTGFQSWRNSSCSLSIKSVQKSVIHR
jgi:hypothetical protein